MTAPSDPAPPADEKWTRLPPHGEVLRGLKRSYLLGLCTAGLVKTRVLPGPPQKGRTRKLRCIRLISLTSLDAYIEGQEATAPKAENE